MPPEDRVRLLHMIEAAEAVRAFVAGRAPTDLKTDRMLLLALERAIEIIGEAAGKVTVQTRENAPEVPWSRISSMRNRLVHAYYDVDTTILWKTATDEVPVLFEQLTSLLSKG